MDLGGIDLSHLTLAQVITLGAVLAAVDTVGAILASIIQKTFNAGFVAVWLVSHVAKRLFPIYALAVLGSGLPVIGLVAIPALFALAVGGLLAYLIETVNSVAGNIQSAPAPHDTSAAG